MFNFLMFLYISVHQMFHSVIWENIVTSNFAYIYIYYKVIIVLNAVCSSQVHKKSFSSVVWVKSMLSMWFFSLIDQKEHL